MKFSFLVYFPDPFAPFQILQLALTQQKQKYIWQGHTYSYPFTFGALKEESREKLRTRSSFSKRVIKS